MWVLLPAGLAGCSDGEPSATPTPSATVATTSSVAHPDIDARAIIDFPPATSTPPTPPPTGLPAALRGRDWERIPTTQMVAQPVASTRDAAHLVRKGPRSHR